MSILRRFFDDLFADLLFKSPPPFARQPGAYKSVEQITEKQYRRHPFVVEPGKHENENDDEETRDRFFGFPIQRLETGILEAAEHHEREKEHQRRQNEFPLAEIMFALCQPKHEERDGGNETGGRGNRKTGKVFFGRDIAVRVMIR